MIIPTDIGDLELGGEVRIPFQSYDPSTDLATALLAGSARVIDLTNGGETALGVTVSAGVQSRAGVNEVIIDTTSGYGSNAQHVVVLDAGTVAGNSAVNRIVGSFGLLYRSSGQVLSRAVQVSGGDVASVDPVLPQQSFTIQGAGLTLSDDFYQGYSLVFQSGSNKGLGRVILRQASATLWTDREFPLPISIGDRFLVLPEDKPNVMRTTYVDVEYGIGQNAGDIISLDLQWDNEVVSGPDQLLDEMRLTAWRRSRTGTNDTPLFDVFHDGGSLTYLPNSQTYQYTTLAAEATAPNDGYRFVATQTYLGRTFKTALSHFNFA